MIASGLHFENHRMPQSRKPIASTPFVLNFIGVPVVMEVGEEHRRYSPADNIEA